MDFSPEVLIDFGLNLAGYLIAALMIYVIIGRRGRAQSQPAPEKKPATVAVQDQTIVTKPVVATADVPRAEFISLSGLAERPPAAAAARPSRMVEPEFPMTAAARKENRRAIYQEARRLLAAGKARSDLLQKLPLTENELELLTVTGKA